MTYWEQCESLFKPLSAMLYQKLRGNYEARITLEDAQDVIRSMFVKCAVYADRPAGDRHKLLHRAMVTEALMLLRRHKSVDRYQRMARQEWANEREVHDNYCFILHELRQAGTPEIPYRIGQLVLYGYEVKEVKSILYLSRHHWEVNQRALRPYLAHVLQS